MSKLIKISIIVYKGNNIREKKNTCEVGVCKGEVFAGCPLCLRYLCHDHLIHSLCANDHEITQEFNTVQPKETVSNKNTYSKIKREKK